PRVRRERMGSRTARGARISNRAFWIESPRINGRPAMMQLFRKQRMWESHKLRPSYDVVIIGAGVHGLGIAYYLASRHGIKNVAVLERGYLGCGNSGRNTAII